MTPPPGPLGSGLLFSQWKILCILSHLIGQLLTRERGHQRDLHQLLLKNCDRAEQQKLLDQMAILDTCKAKNLVYGSFHPLQNPPMFSVSYPPSLTGNNSCHLHLTSGLYLMDAIFLFTGVNVRMQMLYQQGFDVKEGLVRFEAGSLTAHYGYAFFDVLFDPL